MLFAAAMTLLMFIVYSNMQLSQLSRSNQRAVIELQALKREESVLSRRIEAGVSLSEVEAYAVGELGMIKPSKEQIVYIGIPAQDRAEIVRHPGFMENIKDMFVNVGARFAELID
jgi:cell division protein FtsL